MTSAPDVVCIAALRPGQTTVARVQALQSLGLEVRCVDTSSTTLDGPWFVRALEDRLLLGPRLDSLNRRVLEDVYRNRRPKVYWIDKARWLYPGTLKRMKAHHPESLFLHYTPDPAFFGHRSRHFESSMHLYDYCITTKRYEIDEYRNAGAKNVMFTLQGVDSRFVAASSDPARHRPASAVFIGHYEPHYERMLSELCARVDGIEVYGMGWSERTTSKAVRRCIKGSGLWGEDYSEKLKHAKIGVGLLSKKYPDQFTTRTFEIPAAGALLLAERTQEHGQLFSEGVEASFFSTPTELAEKVAHYLTAEQERISLARAGQERAHNSYTWHHVLRPIASLFHELK